MKPPETDPTYRACLRAIRILSWLVPADRRTAWQDEWRGELDHFWRRLAGRADRGAARTSLLRRLLVAGTDAAWLRRQVTRDADLIHDVRHAARLFRRQPGVALSATLVLALATGASTALFSVVEALLLRPLPYGDPDGIVTMWQRSRDGKSDALDEVSPANFLDVRDRMRSVVRLAAAEPHSLDLLGGTEPQTLRAALVTEEFFQILGVRMHLGRAFSAAEQQVGSAPVVILSHAAWQQRFGADPGLIGRRVVLDGTGYEVVGVLPSSFRPRLLGADVERDAWVPKVVQEYERRIRGGGYWAVVGRLHQGTTMDAAQAELSALARLLAIEYPRTNRHVDLALVGMRDHLVGPVRAALKVMAAAVGVVLLLACANVANLLLAHGVSRRHEFSTRLALGAARGRIIRQVLAESLLLGAAGAAAGLLIAHGGLRLIVALQPGDTPGLRDATLDGSVLAFALLSAVATALTAGVAPALQLSRRAAPVLGPTRQVTAGTAERRLQRGLVIAQVALACLLLVGAGLLMRSFVRLLDVDPGFQTARVLTLQVFTYGERYRTPQQTSAFYERALEGIRALPGIESAGLVSAMPFAQANIQLESPLVIEGRSPPAAGDEPSVSVTAATASYFTTLDIPLLQGRTFSHDDRFNGRMVCLVSEGLARRHWPGGQAIGAVVRARFAGRPVRAEVVGIIGEVKHDGLDRQSRPELFLSHTQLPFGSMTFVVRGRGDAGAMTTAVKQVIWNLDPALPFYAIATADDLLRHSVAPRRFALSLISSFAGLAFIVCTVGIYAMVSFAMTRRTREIGVRLTLGASPTSIHRAAMVESARLAGVGVLTGSVAATILALRLQSMLFGVMPADPLTLLTSAGLLLAVAAVAAWLPARRATRTDPLRALRAD